MRVLFATLFAVSTAVAAAADAASASSDGTFKDGDRVCFVGDSVTHWGYYTSQIQNYYYTRFPDWDVRIWNCGTGGATAGEACNLVDRDVIAKRPTAVVVLLGGNDCNINYYRSTATDQMKRNRGKLLENYRKNLPRLHEKIAAALPDAKWTFCTLVPKDDTVKFPNRPDDVPVGITAAQRGFCDFVREYQRKVGGTLVDYYTPMLAWNLEHQKADPAYTLMSDRIHPREPGGLLMAVTFLKAQGAPTVVSETVIDAAGPTTVASENGIVSALERTAAGGVRFSLLERALPFPVREAAKGLAGEIDFSGMFNREMLTVRGLSEGTWTLLVDGTQVCAAVSSAWAKGVNLSNYETPMMRHARTVDRAVAVRERLEYRLRGLWVSRNVMIRRLDRINEESRRKVYDPAADVDDERVYHAFAKGYREAYAGKGDPMACDYSIYANEWPLLDEKLGEIERQHQAVRKLAVPVAHVLELVPEEKTR